MEEENKVEIKQPDKKSGIKNPLLIIVVVIIILGIIPTSVTVPYQKLENYQEQYSEKESYEVQVPYEETVSYINDWKNVKVKDAGTLIYVDKKIYTDSLVNISFEIYNDKETGGIFLIRFRSDNLYNGAPIRVNIDDSFPNSDSVAGIQGGAISHVILPKSFGTIYAIVDLSGLSYKIHYYSLGIITDYDTRTETRYRTETQSRDVVKTRPAQHYVTDYIKKNVFMFQKILGWY